MACATLVAYRGRRSFAAYYRWVADVLRHRANGYRLLDSSLVGRPVVERLTRRLSRRSGFADVHPTSPRAVPGPAPHAARSRRLLKGTCGWPCRPAAALRARSRKSPMRERLLSDASRHRATIGAYGSPALSRVRGSGRGGDTDRAPGGGGCRRPPLRPAPGGDRLLDVPWHGSPGVQRLARRRSQRSACGTCAPRGRFGGWPGSRT